MHPHEFDQQISRISSATTNKTLKVAATELLAALGFTRWIYASENPYSTLGLPVTLANDYGMWILTYMAKGYQSIDPVVAHCRTSTTPIFWETGADEANADDRLRSLMNDARAHGFGSGLAIPMQPPGTPLGMLNVTSPDPLASSRGQFETALPLLQQLGLAMHVTMMRILADNGRRAVNL
jgi:hypothetical protein